MTRSPVLANIAVASAVAAAMLSAVPARAEVALGTYVYKMEHSRYGSIGTHTIKLAKQGAQTIVTVALRIRVKILLVTAHREAADRREVWQGGRLVGYESTTKENDKIIKVSARAGGGGLSVTGPGGTKTAPAGAFLTNPWNVAILKAKTVIDTKTGAIKPVVAVKAQGTEMVTTGSGPVKATKYLFQDTTKRFLWYDAAGRLVKFLVYNDGKTVTFTLK